MYFRCFDGILMVSKALLEHFGYPVSSALLGSLGGRIFFFDRLRQRIQVTEVFPKIMFGVLQLLVRCSLFERSERSCEFRAALWATPHGAPA